MNRELKFRAWDKQNKVMHNNFQFIKSGDKGNDWIIFTSHLQKLSDKLSPLDNPYFSKQFELMQDTGLKDKNGKRIYEGDIVKMHQFTEELGENLGVIEGEIETIVKISIGVMGVMVNKEPLFSYFDEDVHDISEALEVIGNIFENKELLNE